MQFSGRFVVHSRSRLLAGPIDAVQERRSDFAISSTLDFAVVTVGCQASRHKRRRYRPLFLLCYSREVQIRILRLFCCLAQGGFPKKPLKEHDTHFNQEVTNPEKRSLKPCQQRHAIQRYGVLFFDQTTKNGCIDTKEKKMKKMIKPADLLLKSAAQNADGVYNWEKQQYEFDTVKWGTFAQTSSGTSSKVGSLMMSDDSNSDSISD